MKEECTILNREYKAYADLKEPEKAEKVSISELIIEKQKAEDFNKVQDEMLSSRNEVSRDIEFLEDKKGELEKEIEKINMKIRTSRIALNDIPEPEPRPLARIHILAPPAAPAIDRPPVSNGSRNEAAIPAGPPSIPVVSP